ncbi:MAG: tetratricopeptide repeat protein [Bacteroidales bacterium]|nr:tetratricopeptide repeat protein [Bacteroidales bacterium]
MSRVTKSACIVVTLLFFSPFTAKVFSQDMKAAIRLTKSEQFNAAASSFKQLIQQMPANGDNYYYYGRNCLEKFYSDTLSVSFVEKADSAKAIFELGIRQDPSNPINLVGLGGLKLIKKDLPGAKAEFDKVVALFPSRANKAIKMTPERQAKILIQMAEAYVIAKVRDTTTVFDFLRQAEKLDKKNPELYIIKGDVYFYLLNDGSKAITNYNIAQGLDPNSPEAKLRVGQLWLRARQYTTALNYYQEVVKMDSMFAPAYRELGSLLSRAGRQEEAKINFYKFLELSRNIAARKQFVNTLIDLNDYPEAIHQLNEILKVEDTDNDVNRALAYCYYETQEYEKGLMYIQKFISNAQPEKIRSLDYTYHGRLLAKTRQDSLASVQLMTAYELDTSKVDLISEAAASLTRNKSYEKARDLYEQKINLKKGNSLDYYNLGKIYYTLQDYVKADTNLAIFVEMQPDYIPGFAWRARTKSNLDEKDTKGLNITGYAVPVYEGLIEKTQSDTVKYMKERFESFDYLAYYHYSQFSRDQKNKDEAEKALGYYMRMIIVNPNDEKVAVVKPVIDMLKQKIK